MSRYELFPLDNIQVAETVRDLRYAFHHNRKKVILLGAGCSSSAGISTFASGESALAKLGGRAILSEHVFRTTTDTQKHLLAIKAMYEEVVAARPTPFHDLLNNLADRGDDIRIYTQNIDGLEMQCSALSNKNVVAMHGQITKMACPICHYITEMDITVFQDKLPPCPACPNRVPELHPERTRPSLPRPNSKYHGRLRPYILLYDSPSDMWPGLDFSTTLYIDVHEQPAHTIIVAGTALTVPGAVDLLTDLSTASRAAFGDDALVIWVNIAAIPNRYLSKDIFDYAAQGTCDDFARFIKKQCNIT